ncbi:MAG: hypothetical protein M0Q91_05385 [Methanoregula sp.]|jgi:hypothetical protein|nr:hypothetical protein [Methanoregula sp.]
MSSIAVTCPGAIRTKNKRKSMKNTWQTVAWKKAAKEFIKGKSCEWCGSTDKLLPHHPYQNAKDGVYPDLYLSGCIVVCNKCHFMYHRRHKKLCPVCRRNYRHLDTEMCYPCWLEANPGIVKAREKALAEQKEKNRQFTLARNAKLRAIKNKHPCRFHRIRGVCGKSPINSQCPFSPRKAPVLCKGKGFEARKVAT